MAGFDYNTAIEKLSTTERWAIDRIIDRKRERDAKGVSIDRQPESCTCYDDVVRLLDYIGDDSERDFILYKTTLRGIERKHDRHAYFILPFGDQYPIVVTEEVAMRILDNPGYGERLVYNTCMDRYR